ncbi:hypothetical protein FDB55_17580 [Clostridium botulinum]|uniref:hypothetical protein n=1 Tax=Clostridium botulinum TaxID=1491 RepID=UPI000773E22E|nr:hypothetical protein [Clostridium botulinum]NFE13308.1 hypothetical protein [Clostridium botulinum]NFG39437.1 hypothetical protein [Clostridium botulinum]NFL39300.1 hypothetical protein [Clostridium botulinum]NFL43137.1 hypothetical protein [Clostridium botulinum]NFL65822.1 hypothetical protein [Clostridium botulinum]
MRYMERRAELEKEIKILAKELKEENNIYMPLDNIRGDFESYFCCKIPIGFLARRLKELGCHKNLTRIETRRVGKIYVIFSNDMRPVTTPVN